MLRQSSSFFLLVLALLACTATAFFHIAAPAAPRHVLFATKAETVRACGEAKAGAGARGGWLLKREGGDESVEGKLLPRLATRWLLELT